MSALPESEAPRSRPGYRSLAYRCLLAPALRLLGRREGESPPTEAGPAQPQRHHLAQRIAEIDWYHVIDLPGGLSTPGRVDHRSQVGLYGLPQDMRGMRALDVATFDGFWAFEMERRGAAVVAVDIGRWSQADLPSRALERLAPEEDGPTGAGFRLAKELLGSRVERYEASVYDLSPDSIGTFDLVLVSDLLLHLRDPQRALERLYLLTRPGGVIVLAEPYNRALERCKEMALVQYLAFSHFIWWLPSSLALKLMLQVAGFHPVEEVSRFRLNYRHPYPVRKVVLRGHRPPEDRPP